MKYSKKTMKVTYFQNNFSKYQLRPQSLRFRNQDLEKQYQDDLFLDRKIYNQIAVLTIAFMCIAGSIQAGIEGQQTTLSFLLVNSLLQIIAFFKIRRDQHQIRQLIYLLNIYSTFCYTIYLSTIQTKLKVGQIIFLEDITVFSLIFYMKTHSFIWDLLLVLSNRIIICVFSYISIDNYDQSYSQVVLLIILCAISGALSIFRLFKNEKLRRVAFLNSKQREQWNLIVDEVLPINVIISKYNQITGEISLNASNQEAQKNFNVQNDESFNQFMQKIKLDTPFSKKTLRDFILEKHHSISLEKNKRQENHIKQLILSSKNIINDIKSLQDPESPKYDNEILSPTKTEKNPSIKKIITSRSIVKKKMSIHQDQSQKFVEILKGYYCDDWENQPEAKCQYKIQVFQFSVNEPLLLINVENNQEQENIKVLKTTKRQYRELFKDTLNFFQDRIVRLSTEIGQVSIPINQSNLYYDLKFSLMSIFTGIHNILDFVFEKGVNPVKKKQKKDKSELKDNKSKKEHIQTKSQKKDSIYLMSPQVSIENEFNNFENVSNNLHGNMSIYSQNNSQYNNFNNNTNKTNAKMSNGQNSSQNGKTSSAMGNTKIRSFSLRKLLNEISDVMFEKCKQKKVMFFFTDQLAEEYNMVQDQRRIKQNAIDIANKGYIALTVKPHTNLGLKTYRFEIMDSGPGINDDVIVDKNNNLISDNGFSNLSNQVQVVSLRKKSQNMQKQQRKRSSFSNYFQNITTANPQSKKKGLGIAMKVNQKIIAKLGPYFPKIYSESETGTRIVYELYADIFDIINIRSRYRPSIYNKFNREEDIPEDEDFIGLSCYKYTRNELYHFSKNPKSSNLLLSPDSALSPKSNHNLNNLFSSNIPALSTQQQINYIPSISNQVPSIIQSMMNLNTPIKFPSNFSTIHGDNFNQSMPIRGQSLIQIEPLRSRPESMDNVLSMKITRSNQYAIPNSQNNNSFTLESFRSRERSRQDSFFVEMNNKKKLHNQNNQNNQIFINLNNSDEANNMKQNPVSYNGSFTNAQSQNLFHSYKKYSLNDLSNYS